MVDLAERADSACALIGSINHGALHPGASDLLLGDSDIRERSDDALANQDEARALVATSLVAGSLEILIQNGDGLVGSALATSVIVGSSYELTAIYDLPGGVLTLLARTAETLRTAEGPSHANVSGGLGVVAIGTLEIMNNGQDGFDLGALPKKISGTLEIMNNGQDGFDTGAVLNRVTNGSLSLLFLDETLSNAFVTVSEAEKGDSQAAMASTASGKVFSKLVAVSNDTMTQEVV